jgi:phage terminase small subunit
VKSPALTAMRDAAVQLMLRCRELGLGPDGRSRTRVSEPGISDVDTRSRVPEPITLVTGVRR